MNRDIVPAREGLLKAKQLYEDLLLISIRLKQLMDAEDEESWPLESIMELQDKRQEIMQQIDEVELVEGLYSDQRYNSQADNDDKETMAQIRKIILDIQAIELSCQARLEEAKRIIKDKITRVRENKKAQIAYNHMNSYESAWFFDKKS